MSLVQVKMTGQTFASDQENEIIRKLTNATGALERENLLPVAWVSIEEICSGEWDIGGKAMTSGAVHDLATPKV